MARVRPVTPLSRPRARDRFTPGARRSMDPRSGVGGVSFQGGGLSFSLPLSGSYRAARNASANRKQVSATAELTPSTKNWPEALLVSNHATYSRSATSSRSFFIASSAMRVHPLLRLRLDGRALRRERLRYAAQP